MNEEESLQALEELKKKYPALTDEQLLDIMKTGAEKGLIRVAEPEAPETGEQPPGFDIVNALKGGEISIGEAIVLDGYLERKTGKSVKNEILQELQLSGAGKEKEGDLDKMIDRMMKYSLVESFMEGRKAKTQTQQPSVDIEKAIERMGDKMAEALRTHKLEDEKTRAEDLAKGEKKRADEAEQKLAEHVKTEEEEKKLEAKVTEKIAPIQQQIDERIHTIAESLKDVEPGKRRGMILDIGDIISEEVGDEIKNRVVDGLKSAFGEKESLPVTTTAEGKIQVDWYKLGERALKTLDKFIEKLPTAAPPKVPVKEMPAPKLPAPTPTPTTVTETPPPPPQPPTTTTTTTTPPPPPPSETKPEPTAEAQKPIIAETPKEETKEAEKTESEPRTSTQSKESSKVARTTDRRKKT